MAPDRRIAAREQEAGAPRTLPIIETTGGATMRRGIDGTQRVAIRCAGGESLHAAQERRCLPREVWRDAWGGVRGMARCTDREALLQSIASFPADTPIGAAMRDACSALEAREYADATGAECSRPPRGQVGCGPRGWRWYGPERTPRFALLTLRAAEERIAASYVCGECSEVGPVAGCLNCADGRELEACDAGAPAAR